MSAVAAGCPSCGAPIEFRWSGAVQTVCRHCGSVVVRHDVDLEALGKASAPPADRSPVQVGTRGRYRGAAFEVTGRVAYAYDRGRWNEWHLAFADGRGGWLSDAEAQYAVTFETDARALPAPGTLEPGARMVLGGVEYAVRELLRARWTGAEGELPFPSHDRGEVPLADLASAGRACMTIDYGGGAPRAFAGEYVPFAELELKNLREGAAVETAAVETLSCPGCGGSVTVRAKGVTVNVACAHCGAVLDATVPGLKVLRKAQAGLQRKPHLPLGARGRLHGVEWEVIGFQVREVKEEGVAYPWSEYLLWNRERGFRYLVYEKGHWSDEVPLHGVPKTGYDARPWAAYEGRRYRHFARGTAATTYVVGEFPWQVRIGDPETVDDYVAPPFSLSAEGTESERSWTLGEYTTGERVWEAFRLPGKPPLAQGVYLNQPFGGGPSVRQLWMAFALFCALFVGAMLVRFGERAPVARGSFTYVPPVAGAAVAEASEETGVGPFTLGGRPSNVQVKLRTDLENRWAWFDLALMNDSTGEVVRFGREVGRFSGVEDGERWSEGDTDATLRVPSVPAGRYRLVVEPEGPDRVAYTVEVRRDVPSGGFFLSAFLLLLAPPVMGLLYRGGFEGSRWKESDYAPDDDD